MRKLALPSLLVLAASPWVQAAPTPVPASDAAILVLDGGGLDLATLHTLRALTAGELRKRGLPVSEDPLMDGVHPPGAETQALFATAGGRAFALRIVGRLGARVPITLEELGPGGATLAYASLTAASVEECDVVLPRLVEAVLGRADAASTARIDSVVSAESRPFRKKPGERFWIFGLPMPLFSGADGGGQSGFSIGYMYEGEHFGVGVQDLYGKNKDRHINALTLDALWLPATGETSAYLGGGVGYLDTERANGLGVKLSGGIELFRLHALRVRAGLDVCLPLFSNASEVTTYNWEAPVPATRSRVSGPSSYACVHIQVAF